MEGNLDPNQFEYGKTLEQEVDINGISKMMGLNKLEKNFFRHAFYYMNAMVDDQLDVLDLGQVYYAILRIEGEDIPNVPIIKFDKEELPPQILRQYATLLVAKGIIKGLSETEKDYLKRLLMLILTKEELQPVYELLGKMRNAPEEEIIYPVEITILEANWKRNKKILEAA